MPSLSITYCEPIDYRFIKRCKYCKGTNLKSASNARNWCCDCKKSSSYEEKVYITNKVYYR